jgi:hypothetical protein
MKDRVAELLPEALGGPIECALIVAASATPQ